MAAAATMPRTPNNNSNNSRPFVALRRSSSTPPDLSKYTLDILEELDADADADKADRGNTIMGAGGPRAKVGAISFRDAILLSPPPGGGRRTTTSTLSSASSAAIKKPRIKPKFVVKPAERRRRSKSVGDLQALVNNCNNKLGIGNDDDEEYAASSGACDAMDYYHRKAQGQQGRQNGMKLRPDEAKRKQLIINKKDMQRKAARQHSGE